MHRCAISERNPFDRSRRSKSFQNWWEEFRNLLESELRKSRWSCLGMPVQATNWYLCWIWLCRIYLRRSIKLIENNHASFRNSEIGKLFDAFSSTKNFTEGYRKGKGMQINTRRVWKVSSLCTGILQDYPEWTPRHGFSRNCEVGRYTTLRIGQNEVTSFLSFFDATNLLSCMTLDVEHLHSISHIKYPLLSKKEYCRDLGNIITESNKRLQSLTVLHQCKELLVPWPRTWNSLSTLPSTQQLPVAKLSEKAVEEMSNYALTFGVAVRQRTNR